MARLLAKGSGAPGRIRYLVAFAIALVVINVVFVDLPSITGGRGSVSSNDAGATRASSSRHEGTAITLGQGAGSRTTSSTARTRQQDQPLNTGQKIHSGRPASSPEDDDTINEAVALIRAKHHNTKMTSEQDRPGEDQQQQQHEDRYDKGQQDDKQVRDTDLEASMETADDQNAFIALPEDSIDGGDTEGNPAQVDTDGAGGDVEAKADDEGQAHSQQIQSSWELMHHAHHGRDQSKFPFDRDEPADEGDTLCPLACFSINCSTLLVRANS